MLKKKWAIFYKHDEMRDPVYLFSYVFKRSAEKFAKYLNSSTGDSYYYYVEGF